MTISNWMLGLLLIIVVAVKVFWTLDLIGSAVHTPKRLVTSGSLWLGIYNVFVTLLFGFFIVRTFQDPHRQQSFGIALIVIGMAVCVGLAWHFLRREAREVTRQRRAGEVAR